MTIIITKTKLALAILAVALLAPAAALATNVFADVDDGAFYAAPVEWAFGNNITTGKTATSFAPLDNVTRGEAVTFLKRYNDNVVEPADTALQGAIDAAEADIATNTSDITALNSTTCSGRQTGFRVYDSTVVADNKDWFIDVQLPCVASAPLTTSNVNFAVDAAASDGDASCSGTAAEPTAPFGKVCIYVSSSNGVDNLSGSDSLITGTTTFDRRGFTIRGLSNTGPGSDIYARMTWAYTPPLTIILPPIVPPVLAPTAGDLGATAK